MAQQYVIAVSLIALMALMAMSRWATPNIDLVVFTEAKKIEQVMLGYARQRCLDDTDTSDGSTLTSQMLSPAMQLHLVNFINSGAIEPAAMGFPKNTPLPMVASPSTNRSPNTGIVWRFIGWQNGGAMVDAFSAEAKTLTVLKLAYPVHKLIASNHLTFTLSPQRSKHYRDEFSYLSEELFYTDVAPNNVITPAYPIEKRLCLM
jgi:hypothetical protein